MIRKLLIACATGTALLLAGCATNPDGSTNVGGTISNIIADTQAITQQICKFVPTAKTVGDIIAAGNPLLQTAGAIASAICGAVTTAAAPTAMAAHVAPTVGGVKISGHFVK